MKKYYSKRISLFVLILFCFFVITGSSPVYSAGGKSGKKLLNEGERFYENGDYEKALETFTSALPLIKGKKLLSRLYIDLSLTHYALGNSQESEDYLKKLFKLDPGRKIKEEEYPQGYQIIFNKVKAEFEETRAKVIEKSAKKKEKKFPVLLVAAGIAVVGVLAALLSKKKDKNGRPPDTPQPTKGSIRVESSPGEAEIWLDEGNTGNITPAVLANIEPGSHKIELKKIGWFKYEATVTVTAGEESQVSGTLEDSGIEWIRIPEGNFQMGDGFGDGENDERPVHTVYLDEYYISKYEVTFNQFDRFCDETGFGKPYDNGWGRGNRPVIFVNWDAADEFCKWLSEKTGQNVYHPTEAQWEKAAKGPENRKYPWGNSEPNCSKANYKDCWNQTRPVGEHPAGVSYYGVHDMAGNVWEWCRDWYSETYYSSSPTNNPQGPAAGTERVRRGGTWFKESYYLRCSARSHSPQSVSAIGRQGIRIVIEKN